MAVNVLGVGGSMREGSFSTRAVGVALEMTHELGAETRLLDLREIDLPMFRPERESVPNVVLDVAEAVAWADVYILGTPDYHGSMSGTLKNFLDYHWKEFAGKLFATLCASHEQGLTVMDQVRTAVRQCYGWSLPYGVSLHSRQDFDTAGEISNSRLRQRIAMISRDVVVYGALLRAQFEEDRAAGIANSFAAKYRD
jgi:FMN reductase